MQVNRNIAHRVAFETASLELQLIQGAMKKRRNSYRKRTESKMPSSPESR
jgi:hypothetical protein